MLQIISKLHHQILEKQKSLCKKKKKAPKISQVLKIVGQQPAL